MCGTFPEQYEVRYGDTMSILRSPCSKEKNVPQASLLSFFWNRSMFREKCLHLQSPLHRVQPLPYLRPIFPPYAKLPEVSGETAESVVVICVVVI